MRIESVEQGARLPVEHVAGGGFMQVRIVEIVEHETEHDQIRFHSQAVELEKLEFLICRIAGNPCIDDLDAGRWTANGLIQAALDDLGVELPIAGLSGPYERVSEKKDSKVLRGLRADLAVTKTQAVPAVVH